MREGVMFGDTVAAMTPHLGAGAGFGIESGIVLGEELARAAQGRCHDQKRRESMTVRRGEVRGEKTWKRGFCPSWAARRLAPLPTL
jgi:2-polyprenyl-6-methoxyphenol hydroxylase-like FAD-dependent oxidoreductase